MGDADSEGGHSLSWLLLAAAGTEDLRRSHGGLDGVFGGRRCGGAGFATRDAGEGGP